MLAQRTGAVPPASTGPGADSDQDPAPNTNAIVRHDVRPVRAAFDHVGTAVGAGVNEVRGFAWQEAVTQSWRLVVVTVVPAVLIAVPCGVIVTVQVGNLLSGSGADSLWGSVGGFAVVKQGAPLATGLLLGGAGAALIAADLGARTVRGEIDALRAMGIDPMRRLVIPRLVAMAFVAPLLDVVVIAVGIAAGYVVAVGVEGIAPGSYWSTFGSFVTVLDVWMSLLKALVAGIVVVLIACRRGLTAGGGPRGVADAVNAAVAWSVVAIVASNVVLTQLVGLAVPARLV
ncbi:ABC transporter permease [Nocardia sp. NPDC056064]|uniref:ABC transporter permease n=1 Tax=Nocardia sp. NPDC056064 TaxID=3345701 RepID=UPI0035E2F9C6